MNVLIIGSGGREHALAWKAAQSAAVETVYVAPGNAGTAIEPKVKNINLSATDIPKLEAFAKEHAIALTIVGPEAPLAAGIVDTFDAAGLRCFGPTKAAARLESSKEFCKDFMHANHIPTARYQCFEDVDAAKAALSEFALPVVIKADGLAAGKGVIIAQSEEEAIDAIESMLMQNAFGEAGARIVMEDFLTGQEASFIAMVDGTHILPLATSQDHKARDDGDKGPNTGGMGAYSPAPVVTPDIHDKIMQKVMIPTVAGMHAAGTPFKGFLYAGVMISPEGDIHVLEFNCRFGDPETQPILMRLESDLVALCNQAIDGTLDKAHAQWDERPALGVVLAAGGYPGSYLKGKAIHGTQATMPDAKLFHAGTKLADNSVVTDGGRVLCAVAKGDDLADAKTRAYQLAQRVQFDGVFFRKDIGDKAL